MGREKGVRNWNWPLTGIYGKFSDCKGGEKNGVLWALKVARYSFSGSIPPTFERKLRRHKQRFGKIDTTVVLDKDENLL